MVAGRPEGNAVWISALRRGWMCLVSRWDKECMAQITEVVVVWCPRGSVAKKPFWNRIRGFRGWGVELGLLKMGIEGGVL